MNLCNYEQEIIWPKKISLIDPTLAIKLDQKKKKKKNSPCPWSERARFSERGLGKAGKYHLRSSRTFYFLYHLSCCSLSPEAASQDHLGSHNGSILFNPLVGIGHYNSAVWDFPEQIFLLVLICFSLEQYAEALIRMVHRDVFLVDFF